MGRICPSGDVVLLMLSLVLSDHETRSTRVGEECDDGRAHGHDEILDECFHVLAHRHFAPFQLRLSQKISSKRFEGLVAGLGVWFDEFWFEFSFPVREKYFSSQESDFSALSESRCKDTAFLIPSRAMLCDAVRLRNIQSEIPKILPFSLLQS